MKRKDVTHGAVCPFEELPPPDAAWFLAFSLSHVLPGGGGCPCLQKAIGISGGDPEQKRHHMRGLRPVMLLQALILLGQALQDSLHYQRGRTSRVKIKCQGKGDNGAAQHADKGLRLEGLKQCLLGRRPS